ncbi:MAG: GDP-mannose 4,6-dehydratase, partial [Thermaerobacter sp.]|nr:GDP-mannose 4,6-dehydratase [Thermaerobacter sp.]
TVDPRYFRPSEVESLLGDASLARTKLGWVPKISFEELVREMARTDLKAAQCDDLIRRHGYPSYNFNE